MLLSGDRSKSLEPFRLQRVFNFLPAPSYYRYEGAGVGEKMMVACTSVSWRLLDATWTPAGGRDFGGASDSQDKSGGENNLVIQSLLFCFF